MTPQKFIAAFSLAVLLTISFFLVATYFDIKKYQVRENPKTEPLVSLDQAKIKKNKNDSAQNQNYSLKEYPLEKSQSGNIKSIDLAKDEIAIVSNGNYYYAVVSSGTEIFRLGKRAVLADIKQTDFITILGRKKNENSDIFVADSIYANTDVEDIAIEI